MAKKLLRDLLSLLGYQISKKKSTIGEILPYFNFPIGAEICVFDVGANVGQSAVSFHSTLSKKFFSHYILL
jgi:hypothetical protein